MNRDLLEIWVSRIVDVKQVHKPSNMADGLANLCMLFPGSLGEDDVKLFRELLRKRRKFKPRVIEIPVDHHIDFQWNHSNLRRGIADGYDAVDRLLGQHPELLH